MDLLAGVYSDADVVGAADGGMAVLAASTNGGEWQYSCVQGSPVYQRLAPAPGTAVLLGPRCRLRFEHLPYVAPQF